MINKVKRT